MRRSGYKIAVTCLMVALPLQVSAKAKMICDDLADDACFQRLIASPPPLTKERLPKGYKIGKCLLEVDGKTRISGPCSYIIYKGGEFHIDGPRQVFGGIDYPDPNGSATMTVTTDFWANVFKDEDGKWTGYGNEDARYSKGDGSIWGELLRDGACYSNNAIPKNDDEYRQAVKVCLWKK
jgi:hypothetical protein